jgi:cytochrome c-type biogenesis protein CcsB
VLIKNLYNKLFSTSAAGMYLILIAVAIAVATFVENDFGTSAAQKIIFKSRWFELLLLLCGISIVANIIRYRMVQQKKWTILLFHLSIIIILIGSAVTRYIGYEGMMHIREGASNNEFTSAETYLQFEANKDGKVYRFDEQVLFASLGRNKLNRSYQLGNEQIDVEVLGFIANPGQQMQEDPAGGPVLEIVIAGAKGREQYYLSKGQQKSIGSLKFNFSEEFIPNSYNIVYRNDSLLMQAPEALSQMQMATQSIDTIDAGKTARLALRSLYSNGSQNFVFTNFKSKGKVILVSTNHKVTSESMGAVRLAISSEEDRQEMIVYGRKGQKGQARSINIAGTELTVSYGSKSVSIPFKIHLHDFIMDRYPGTNSPSSYASEVTLIDEQKNEQFDYRIYMNNILDHRGYRFFQSSYDKDEMGTYLSVNHDAWGTWISYLGYFLLTLGMILTLFSRKSRFYKLSQKISEIRGSTSAAVLTMLLFISASPLIAQNDNQQAAAFSGDLLSVEHADKFGQLIVQDHRGRMKPMNTMSSEVLRKIARKESMYDQTSDQIFIGMMVFPDVWSQVPLLKIGKHPDLLKIVKKEGPLVAFEDLFAQDGSYILREHVRAANEKPAKERGVFEKELVKLDERVNICNMVFSRRLTRIFPIENDPTNRWLSPADLRQPEESEGEIDLMFKFFPAYATTVREAVMSQDWTMADALVQELTNYQKAVGADIIPSDKQLNLEIWLNKMHVFAKLAKWYGLIGLLCLIAFFVAVFSKRFSEKWPVRIAFILTLLCFIFHTAGLGVRWYVSGHAPWSNGYESMIYIAWTSVLAGLVFARKSLGGLTATLILSSVILLVAGLSYLDPEITPLVPVLKSYWLTIHVSLEAGSYGFLMLGAIIGVLNLLSMIFLTPSNKTGVMKSIKELTYISEMTLIGGLIMISVGTYLGGVWANESWGRYWGWDAKETWALVTILIYAFMLHMRFIPGMRGVYAFNVSSLVGFASVIMTYYGVNYYLSGLHSYATGDPVPIPAFVYYAVAFLVVISLIAFWRYRKVTGKS